MFLQALATHCIYVSSPLIPQQSCTTVFLVRSITGHLAWNWGHLDWKYAPECIIQWYYVLSVKCTPFVIHGKRLNYESFMAFRTAGLMCDIIQYVTVRLYVTILWIKSMPFPHTSNCRMTKKSLLEQGSLEVPCEQQTIWNNHCNCLLGRELHGGLHKTTELKLGRAACSRIRSYVR